MQRSLNWGDVMSSAKTCEKPSCCVLDQLEAGKRLLIYANKEGVTVV